DDHSEPLKELSRLLTVHRAYSHMNEGDLFVEKGDMAGAMKEYNAAMQMFPQNLEMKYWTAITLANNKKIQEATNLLKNIYLKDPHWRELTRRLPKVGLLTVSETDFNILVK
ncbi:MAG: tetratricopeptide repeat protein, partial [Ferruginibacter sp.]